MVQGAPRPERSPSNREPRGGPCCGRGQADVVGTGSRTARPARAPGFGLARLRPRPDLFPCPPALPSSPRGSGSGKGHNSTDRGPGQATPPGRLEAVPPRARAEAAGGVGGSYRSPPQHRGRGPLEAAQRPKASSAQPEPSPSRAQAECGSDTPQGRPELGLLQRAGAGGSLSERDGDGGRAGRPLGGGQTGLLPSRCPRGCRGCFALRPRAAAVTTTALP